MRRFNNKTNWSNWEEADNGLNLKLTPNGRYLEVEVTLEKFNSTQSPVVHDITINTLNSNVLITDLGVSITGNQSSLNVDENVKIIITAFNKGPNTATVYSDLPDLNPVDNPAIFNLVANDPNLEDIPAGELNGLPYTFPDDVKPQNNSLTLPINLPLPPTPLEPRVPPHPSLSLGPEPKTQL